MAEGRKLVELEALRGIAAIVVFIGHFFFAFAPHIHGVSFLSTDGLLVRTPLFIFLNGSAAVVFFFVLSGFVLPLRFLSRAPSSADLLAAGARRWPRLALPSLITALVSALLMWLGLYAAQPAGAMAESQWLASFFKTPDAPLNQVLGSAALEAAFGIFWKPASTFNPVLWTMYYELWGSLLVFAALWLVRFLPRPWVLPGFAVGIGAVFAVSPFLSAFMAGLFLAVVYTLHRPWLSFFASRVFRWAALLVIALLGGFAQSVGFYSWLAPVMSALGWTGGIVAVHAPLSVLAIALVLTSQNADALKGPAAIWLGRLSFPIYLTHLLVIGSLSSRLFISGMSVPLLFAITAIVVLIASLPMMAFDQWIVRTLRKRFTSSVRPGALRLGS